MRRERYRLGAAALFFSPPSSAWRSLASARSRYTPQATSYKLGCWPSHTPQATSYTPETV